MKEQNIVSLLTVEEVAAILKVRIRTVYDNRKNLGGFYPAGIRVLRFHPDVIRGIVERQGIRHLEIQVSNGWEGLRRGWPQNKESGNSGPGTAKAPGQTRSCFRLGKTDPDRHGLSRGRPYVSDQKQKAKRGKI